MKNVFRFAGLLWLFCACIITAFANDDDKSKIEKKKEETTHSLSLLPSFKPLPSNSLYSNSYLLWELPGSLGKPGKPLPKLKHIENRDLYQYDSSAGSFRKLPALSLITCEAGWVQMLGFDPVRFSLKASKDSVRIGEEFELTITAEYIKINSMTLFTLEGSNEYTLKMILPEGFIPTGGDYYDFIKGKVDEYNPKRQYTIKGKFENIDNNPCFTLLRSHSDADINSLFIKKAEVCVVRAVDLPVSKKNKSARSADDCAPPAPSKSNDVCLDGLTSIKIWAHCSRGTLYWVHNGVHTDTITVNAPGTYSAQCLDNNDPNGCFSAPSRINVSNNCCVSFPIPTPTHPSPTEVIPLGSNWITLFASGCNGTVVWNNFATGSAIIVSEAMFYYAQCKVGQCVGNPSSGISVSRETGCSSPVFDAPQISSNKTVVLGNDVATITASNCGGAVKWYGPDRNGYEASVIYATAEGNYYATCTNQCGVASAASNSIYISRSTLYITASKTSVYPINDNLTLTVHGCDGFISWILPDQTVSFDNPLNYNRGGGNFWARCHRFGENVYYAEATIHIDEINNNAVTISASATEAYANQTVSLTANGCPGGYIIWSIGGVLQSNLGRTINVPPGYYEARCWYSESNIGPPASILINTRLPGSLTLSANKSFAAAGEPVVLTASSCGSGVYVNWRTPTGGGELSGNIVTVYGFGEYSARCWTSDGPGGAGPWITIYIPAPPVNPNGPPTLSIVSSRTCVSDNETITLKASGCPSGGKVEWSTGATSGTTNKVIARGNPIDARGPNTYNARCVINSITGFYTIITVPACPATAPRFYATKTSARVGEPLELISEGCPNGAAQWGIPTGGGNYEYGNFRPTIQVEGPGVFKGRCTEGAYQSFVDIEVFPASSDALKIVSNKTKAGPNDPVVLTAIGCDYGTVQWQWGSSPSIAQGLTINVSGPGVYQAYCKNDPTNDGDLVQIEIRPAAPIVPSISAPATACPGQLTEVTGSGCPSGYSVQWRIIGDGYWEYFLAHQGQLKDNPTADDFNNGILQFKSDNPLRLTGPRFYWARCVKNDLSWIGDFEDMSVTVDDAFPPEFQAMTSNGTSICSGTESVQLAATNLDGVTYNWSGPNGFQSSSRFASVANPTAGASLRSGIYTVTATKTSGGCTATATVSVTIKQSPIPTIGSNSPVCEGKPINLTSSGGNLYNWAGPNSFTSNAQNPSRNPATLAMGGIYTVTVTSTANNCFATTTASVTVKELPDAPDASNVNRCGAGTVTLSVTGCSGTVTWYGTASGGSSLGTGGIYTTTSLAIGTTTYYADCSVNGCASTTRTPVVATVYPFPSAPTAGNNNKCGTGTVALSVTGCSGTVNWYATLTGGASLTTGAVYTTPSISSTTTYYTDCTVGTCTNASRTAVIATINTIPSAPTAGNNSRCGTGTVALSVTGCSGTVNWYATLTGGASLTTGASYTTPSISATTTYYTDCTVGTCTNATRTAVIATINTIPSAPTAGNNSRCGTGTVALSVTGCSGTVNWYATLTGGASLTTGASYTTPSISSTTTYYTDCTVGTCTNASRTAVIATINTIPSAPTAGNNSRCGTGTVALSVTGCSGTVNWYATLTGGASLTTGASYTTPSISSTTTYYTDCTVGTCTNATRTAVIATINTIPSAPTAGNNSRCGTGTVALSVTGCSGTVNWYATLTGGASLTTGASYTTPSISSTTTYYTDCTVGTCTNATRTAVIATINTIPSAPTAGNNSRCGTGTVALSVTGCSGTVNWYATLTGGASLTTGASYTTPSISATTTYYTDCTVGTCTNASRTAVIATINTIPSAPTAGNNSRCGTGTVALSVTGCSGTVNWYATLTGGASLTTGASYTTPSISATTTYYTDCTVGTCTNASRTAVIATINTIPSAPTAISDDRCGAGSVTLSVSGCSGTVNWYATLTGGASLTTGASYTTPSISSTTTYYTDCTVGTCTNASRTAVIATINTIPSAPTAGNNSRCGTGTVALSVTGCSGTVNWYATLTGGASLTTGASYTTPSISATTTYYTDCTVGTCTNASRTAVIATINTIPSAPTAISDDRCGAGSVTLSVSGCSGTVNWYATLTGGASLTTGAAYTTPSISSTTTYYTDCTVGTCTNTTRTAVIATINTIPSAPTAGNNSRCGTGTVALSVTGCSGTVNWYATLTGGASLTTGASYTTPSISATTTYYTDCTVGTCTNATRTAVIATINTIPSAPTAISDDRCGAGSVTLSVSGCSGTVNWYATLTGGASLTTGASYTTPSISSTTTYYTDCTVGTCTNATRTAVIATINTIPSAPTAGNNSRCGTGTVALSVTGCSGTVNWYATLTGGASLTTGASYTTPSISSTTTYYTDCTVGTCTNATRTAVIATINTIPSAPTAGNNSRCGTGTVALSVTGCSGTVNWYATLTGGASLTTGASYTTPSISSTTTYYTDCTVGTCTNASRTAVIATINTIPSAPTAGNNSRCGTGTVALSVTGCSGTVNWYATLTGGASLTTGASYTTPSISATTTYYTDCTVGTCTNASRTAVIATINTIPSAPTAGNNSRCGTGTVALSVTGCSGTVNWYATLTGGASLTTGASYTTPSISATTTYYTDCTVGTCTNATRTAVIATINTIPSAPTAISDDRCGAGSVTLSVSGCSGTVNWYATLTGGASLTTGASYTTPSISATTTYYTDCTVGTCTNATRTAVIATINTIPSAPTAISDDRCGAGSVTLSVSGCSGTVNWYATLTGGASLTTGAVYTTPSISSTTTYYTDCTVGTCTNTSRTAVIATINTIPSAPTAGNNSKCGTGTVALSVTGCSGTVNWYATLTGGASLTTGAVYTTPSISSTTTYYTDCTVGTCTNATRTAVIATINTIPSAPTAGNNSRCGTGTVALSVTGCSGTVNWYATLTGGASLTTGASYTTPSISATTTYYTDCTVGTCTNASRTAVIATINTIPSAPTAGNNSRCGTGTVALSVTGCSGTVNWYATLTGGASLTTGAAYTTPSISSTTTYYTDCTVGTCTNASRTAVIATINTIPSAPTAISDDRCGAGSVTLSVSGCSGTVNWYATLTGGASLTTGASYTTPSISSTTTYYTDCTVGTCTNASRTAVIATINTIPSAPTAGNNSRCGTGTVALSVTGCSGTVNWYATLTGGASLTTGASYTTPSISATTTYYTDCTVGTCTNASRTAVIATINTIPSAPTAISDDRCGAGSVTLSVSGCSGTVSWYATLTGGASLTTGAVYTTPSISSTTTYYTDCTVGTCTNTSRTAVIATINTIPSAPTAGNNSRCGTGTVALSVTGCSGTVNWYATLTGGASLTTGASYTTPSISSTTTYYTDCTVGTCTNTTRTAVIATINTIPSAPTAISDDRCGAGSVTLSVSGCSGTVNWYATLTGGASLTTGASYTTPSISSTTTYYTDCTVGTCTNASRTAVIATINTIPSAPTAGNNSRCGTGTVALSVTGCSGTVNWYATLTGGASLTTGASYTTPSISSTTTYYTDCTVGTCTNASRTAVIATINTIPSAPTAGNNSRCGTGTVALSVTGCSGTVNWYATLTGGASLTTGAAYTTPSISATTTYYTDCTVGTCTNATRTAVIATINTIPSAPTAGNNSRCGTGTVALSVTGCSGTVNWYTTLTGGVSLTTGASYTTPSISSTTTYYTDCTVGTCTNATRTAVIATINTIPSAPTAISDDRCGAGSVTLSVSGCSGTVNWYATLTGGASLTTGASYTTPSISSTTTYYTDCTVGTCTNASRTAVIATINTIPSAPTAISDDRCGAGSVTLSVSGCSGTVNWYATLTGGASLTTGASYTTPSISATTTYYTDCTVGTCTNATRTAVIATINTIPSAPTAGNNSRCGTGTVALSVTGCSGTVNWYTTLTGGASLTTGASYTTPSISSTTTYYTDCTVGTCTNASRTAVIATINTVPSAPTAGNNSRCGTGTVALSVTGCSGTVNWYTTLTGGASLTTGASYTTPSISATTTYYTDCTVGTCTNATRTPVVATINPLPSASLNSPTICQGTSVALTPNGVSNVNSYSWNTGATTSSISVSPTSTTNYTVTLTSLDGCTATVTTSVTVNPLPSASLNSPTICQGTSATLTPSGMSHVNSYSWNTGATTSSISVSPTSTTNYTVTLTSLDGCTAMVTTAISVNALPVATADFNSSVCLGQSLSLSATGGESYSWSGPNNFTSTEQNPVVSSSVALIHTGTYTVTVTNNGCTATASVSIPENIIPPNVTFTGTDNLTCTTTSVTRTASGGETYLWSNNLGTSATANITTPGNYTVTVTGGNGCTTTATTSVTMNNLLSTTIESNSPICVGKTLNLSASGGTSYSWSGPNSFSSADQNPGINNVTSAATGIYTVTITTNGCTATATTSVTVNDLPSILISNNSPLCAGQDLNLSATGGVSYSWTGPNSFNSSSSTPTITDATLAMSGVYTISVTGTNNCTMTATTSVTINPKPEKPTLSTPNAEVCILEGVGFATLNASGCSGTIIWEHGETGSSITISVATTDYYRALCKVGDCSSDYSDPLQITVKSNPLAPIITANKPVYCTSDPAGMTLTATGCNGTVLWNTGLTTSAITVSPTTATHYSVTCTNDCGTSSPGTFNVYVSTIISPPTILPENPAICSTGGSVTLTASGCEDGTFLWSTNTSGSAITVSQTGTYSVKCLGFEGCESLETSITVGSTTPLSPLISSNVDPNPNGRIACGGNSEIRLYASGCDTYGVTWSDGQTGTSIVLTKTGDLRYQIRCESSCQEISEIYEITILANEVPEITTEEIIDNEREFVKLTATGCSDKVLWSDGQTGSTITVEVTNTPVDYSATCTYSNAGARSIQCSIIPSRIIKIMAECRQIVAGTVNLPSSQSTKLTTGCASSVIWSNGTAIISTVGNLITWADGETAIVEFSKPFYYERIKVSPTKTTTYTSTCVFPDKVCTSSAKINVDPAICNNFQIAAVVVNKALENQVKLTATGCQSGNVIWLGYDETSTILDTTFPLTQEKAVVYATCLNDDGTECHLKKEIELYVTPEIPKNDDGVDEDCYDNIWNLFNHDKPFSVYIEEAKNGELTLKVTDNSCREGNSVKWFVGEPDTNEPLGYTFQLLGPEPSTGESYTIPIPDEPKLYKAICGNGCNYGNVAYVHTNSYPQHAPELIITVDQTKQYRVGGGANEYQQTHYATPPTVLYGSNYSFSVPNDDCRNSPSSTSYKITPALLDATGGTQKIEGNILSITNTHAFSTQAPYELTTVTATCIVEKDEEEAKTYTFSQQIGPKILPCLSVKVNGKTASASSIKPYKIGYGESLNFETIGCTGAITWKRVNLLTGEYTLQGSTSNKQFTDVPAYYQHPSNSDRNGAYQYEIHCDATNCETKDVTAFVTVGACTFKISSSKGAVKIGEEVVLTATGCTGGTITWSNGSVGSTTKVSVLPATPFATFRTYTGTCSISGQEMKCTSGTQISIEDKTLVTPECPDLVLTPDATSFFCPNIPQKITITPSGCTSGGIEWIVDGLSTKQAKDKSFSVFLSSKKEITATCTTEYGISTTKTLTIGPSTEIAVNPDKVYSNYPVKLTATGCYSDNCEEGSYSWFADALSTTPFWTGKTFATTISQPTSYYIQCNNSSDKKRVTINTLTPSNDCIVVPPVSNTIRANGIEYSTRSLTAPNCDTRFEIKWEKQECRGVPGFPFYCKTPYVYARNTKKIYTPLPPGNTRDTYTDPLIGSFEADTDNKDNYILTCINSTTNLPCVSYMDVYPKYITITQSPTPEIPVQQTTKEEDKTTPVPVNEHTPCMDAQTQPSFEAKYGGSVSFTSDWCYGNGSYVVIWEFSESKPIVTLYTPASKINGDIFNGTKTYHAACYYKFNGQDRRCEIQWVSTRSSSQGSPNGRMVNSGANLQNVRTTTTNDEDCPEEIAVSKAMQVFVGQLLCDKINLMKNADGTFSRDKALLAILSVIESLKKHPEYDPATWIFPTDYTSAINALENDFENGACTTTASTYITSGFTGDINLEDVADSFEDASDQLIDDLLKITVTVTTTNATCNTSNGTITITATNGTAPYQYSIDGTNFQDNNVFENLAAGTYIITVKESRGNITTVQATVAQTPPLTLTATSTNVTCVTNNGSISLTASGGKQPYQYSLDGTSFTNSNTFSDLAPDIYNLTVKDASNCTANTTVTITEPESYEVIQGEEEPVLGIVQTNPNVRITLDDDGFIIVRQNKDSKPTKFKLTVDDYSPKPYKGGKLTINSGEYAGTYIPYFYACNPDIFIGLYKENCLNETSGTCTPTKSEQHLNATLKKNGADLCKECWLPDNAYEERFDNNQGEYDSYEEYQTALGTRAIPENTWTGQDAHWLISDRENCTDRWKNSCWNIIKHDLKDRLQPFSQIRDFYKWVRRQIQIQGHEVRWALGADLLVHKLSLLEIPPQVIIPLEAKYIDLLKDLNTGIANYSLHRWKELLVDNMNSPIVGTNAYNWDKSFIYEEQGQIAPPIYDKYEQQYPEAINRMNSIVHQITSDDPVETVLNLIIGYMSGIPKFDIDVSCTDTQYRIDFPLKMLYPQTHNPVHGILIGRGNQDFINVPFLPITFCNP